MPARARRSSHAIRRPRRKLVWSTVDQTLTLAAVGNGSNIDLLTALKVGGASILGTTIMRTHLALDVFSAVALADNFYWGLAVLPNSQLVTNVAVSATVVNPAQNPEIDWMMWKHEYASPTYGESASNNTIPIDVRAKRRLEELNETYCFSLRGSAGAAFTAQLSGRVLLALP